MQYFILSQTTQNTVKQTKIDVDRVAAVMLVLIIDGRLELGCASFLQISDHSGVCPPPPHHLSSSWLASTKLEGKSQHLDRHLSHSGTQEIKPAWPQVDALSVRALCISESLRCRSALLLASRSEGGNSGCPHDCAHEQRFRNES